MNFHTIASGSSGNCYHISCGETQGLIEAGIPWKRVQKALDFNTSSLDFVLATHRHADHSGYIEKAIKAGVDVYAIQDVWDSKSITSHRAHVITPLKQFQIKTLTILPFPVPHDVENVGFLIADDQKNKLLYLTDAYYTKFAFKEVGIFAIECNYSAQILEKNIEAGVTPAAIRNRIIKSHFELENVKEFFRVNDLSKCEEIYLIHISGDNGDPDYFRSEIQKITGVPVYTEGV